MKSHISDFSKGGSSGETLFKLLVGNTRGPSFSEPLSDGPDKPFASFNFAWFTSFSTLLLFISLLTGPLLTESQFN